MVTSIALALALGTFVVVAASAIYIGRTVALDLMGLD